MSTSCYYLLDNIHFFTTFNLNVMFRKEFFKTADTFLFILKSLEFVRIVLIINDLK